MLAEPLGRELGQPLSSRTRAAAAVPGAAETARATPDGYNLGMATVSTTATNPAINPKIPYNVFTDFTPVVNVAATPNVIAANPTRRQGLQELPRRVKEEPGKYRSARPAPAASAI